MGILDRNNAKKICEPEYLFLHTKIIPKLADFQRNSFYMTKNNFIKYCGDSAPYDFFEYLIKNNYIKESGYNYSQKEVLYQATQKFNKMLRLYAAKEIVRRYETKKKKKIIEYNHPEIENILNNINSVTREYEYVLAKKFIEENE